MNMYMNKLDNKGGKYNLLLKSSYTNVDRNSNIYVSFSNLFISGHLRENHNNVISVFSGSDLRSPSSTSSAFSQYPGHTTPPASSSPYVSVSSPPTASLPGATVTSATAPGGPPLGAPKPGPPPCHPPPPPAYLTGSLHGHGPGLPCSGCGPQPPRPMSIYDHPHLQPFMRHPYFSREYCFVKYSILKPILHCAFSLLGVGSLSQNK